MLELLGFRPRSTHGAQQRGPCPLHGSSSGTSRSFSVNLDQHLFHCFKCGKTGNALDLWAHASAKTPYDAALDLCRRLNIAAPPLPTDRENREEAPVDVSSNPATITELQP